MDGGDASVVHANNHANWMAEAHRPRRLMLVEGTPGITGWWAGVLVAITFFG